MGKHRDNTLEVTKCDEAVRRVKPQVAPTSHRLSNAVPRMRKRPSRSMQVPQSNNPPIAEGIMKPIQNAVPNVTIRHNTRTNANAAPKCSFVPSSSGALQNQIGPLRAALPRAPRSASLELRRVNPRRLGPILDMMGEPHSETREEGLICGDHAWCRECEATIMQK
ncbi:hypothetical protein BCR34DRAFT_584972 [Clohesyomyces aquaticus]|uniref:Uncharacterized protein n=1 Tax=Clohesyomyces aquaticus TaxID=1231657 RepID=A0A1Y1ZZ86_9PLEO|nr:hypothetical protein BCR34DRAFT_584972 [Clohesyomyces aquaticus]